tara:strand:+ start:515 stop:637 length:123 start_codon:yes stop_codon:yes gene_type:complete
MQFTGRNFLKAGSLSFAMTANGAWGFEFRAYPHGAPLLMA